MKTDEIRERYLTFFKERGHTVVPSDSLVPTNDPSLLFTGAGMNQFKEMFLGRGKMEYTRATSCQKCLRTGDIENVGRTARHHTFFEMLGNFSFGDYFKREAINWAWEFLLNEMKIPSSRLRVSVYKDDDEAYGIWADEIGVAAEMIYRFGAKDNYWPANAVEDGPNGPCGPCSEIFFDYGEGVGCGSPDCSPACDCDRFVEIWNLVFTQFERQDGGKLIPLPQKNIDTGMSLERLASVVQGKRTNYDIDIFHAPLNEIGRFTGAKYGADKETDRRMKRISDHARAVVFMISDGVLPANEGRGYVLRRLLRRAVSDGIAIGAKDAFVYRLVPVIAQVMGGAYGEILAKRENIAQIVKADEERFLETLAAGEDMIEKLIARMKEEGRKVVGGEEAFNLYDTFGYPIEFLVERMGEHGFEVDLVIFKREMDLQRERARAGSSMAADIFAGARSPVHDLASKVAATVFTGYHHMRTEATVKGVIKGPGLADKVTPADGEVAVVLDTTPFYAQSGGQVGDTGEIRGDNFTFVVKDTQGSEGLYLHMGAVTHGTLVVGAPAVAEVDAARRADIMRNHTATHLLQYALRKRLGAHVEQSGSLVTPERLRFDFTHFQAVRREELRDVERIVNGIVAEDMPVKTEETTLADARGRGVIALFGEKYGDEVRVVSVGDVSAELCGGTHLHHAGSIGFFKVISEESVAQGVRRITAVTGAGAVAAVHGLEDTLGEVSANLDAPLSRLVERSADVVAETRRLRKELEKVMASKASSAAKDLASAAKSFGSLRAIVERVDNLGVDELRKLIDGLKKETALVTILASVKDGKVALIGAVTKDLVAKGVSAANLIKAIAPEVEGGGGGKPDMAQAGGKNPAGVDRALDKARAEIEAVAAKLQ
jgi:alanyl-tRNA synthetase